MVKLNQVIGAVVLLWLACSTTSAQQGHPLSGSWSGERVVDGRNLRLLMVLDLQRDQSFSGYIIENRARIALTSVMLDPSDWSVHFMLEGQDREGNPVVYEVEGAIENLGSSTARQIVGTWTDGGNSGPFRVMLN